MKAAAPKFVAAIMADARITAAHRGERFAFRSTVDALTQAFRLALVTDAFFALCLYRLKVQCQARRIPVLPGVLQRLAMTSAQVSIGDPVVVEPGVYLIHGQIVIDGFTEIGSGTSIGPFVTIGLVAGNYNGPTIGQRVSIGTGAKILGPVRIGNNARIGANAVVLQDVPEGATAVGVPARIVAGASSD